MDMILRFEEVGLDRQHLDVIGRKAWRLATMWRSGFPVPGGFAITSKAYEAFVAQRGLQDRILEELSAADGSQEGLQEKAARIREMILEVPLPSEVEGAIIEAYRQLGQPCVAVRSSSLHEDSRNHTFAGQHSTFLGVSKEEELLEKVRTCFASLHEARAIVNRERAYPSITHDQARMPVVVQRMVGARKAGVVFTRNPVTGAPNELVIEAVAGLGETLVAGEVQPERYVLHPSTGAVQAKWPARQRIGLFVTGDGVENRKITINGSDVLAESERRELAQAARRIVGHFGGTAQDIEWAIGDQLWILQSRDVTPHRGLYEGVDWRQRITRAYGVQYAEISLRALSPEVADIVPYTFYDQIYMPRSPNEVCYIGGCSWQRLEEAAQKTLAPDLLIRLERDFFRTARIYEDFCHTLSAEDLSRSSSEELLSYYRGYQARAVRYCAYIWLTYVVNELIGRKVDKVMSQYVRNADERGELLSRLMVPEERSAVHQRRTLARQIDLSDESAKKELFGRFSWLPCLDLHNEPETFGSFAEVLEKEARGKVAPNSELTPEVILERLELSESDGWLLDAARRFVFIKDVRDDFRRRGVYYIRSSLFREIATRMNLPLAEVSFLQEREIVAFLETGAIPTTAAERREGFLLFFDAERRLTCLTGAAARKWIAVSGPAEVTPGQSEGATIDGIAASRGRARGRAVVVRGIHDLSKVNDGDVLVAVTTNPDYVSTMQTVAAIITDEGGTLSHAAIIARDCGIPCVVGTRFATERLKDGDEVLVDASHGIIHLLKSCTS